MNPIFAREWRARWREARSFWLLLALVLLLSLVAGWVYYSAVNWVQYTYVFNLTTRTQELKPVVETLQGRASRTGRSLFQSLALGNCIVCLFLAPALAAPGIARERERGLIEGLQLSHMRPASQILARYLSSVAFLFAIQIATLPMYGIVLYLGGVSLGEMGFATFLIALTLLLGAALGIWFSARSYRPTSALFGVLGAIALWSGYSWWMALSAFTVGKFGAEFWWACLHPAVLLQYFIRPEGFTTYVPPGFSPASIAASAKDALIVTTSCYAVLIPVLLWSAIRKVNAPLPAAAWHGRNRYIEKRKAQLAAQRAEAQARREQARLGEQVQGALVADLPVEKLVRFRDPLLSREVKGRFRLRKGSILITLLRFAAFVAGASLWLGMLFSLFDPIALSRKELAPRLIYSLWGLGVASVSALAATSFAREKESGTWEGLRLALLRPGEIVRAKWLSVLASFAYYSAPLWLLLPFAIWRSGLDAIPSVVLGALIALASLGAFCAFGLWVSWRAPHPTAALSWTLGVVFALLVAVPQIEDLGGLERQVSFARYGVSPLNNYQWYDSDQLRERAYWERLTSTGSASYGSTVEYANGDGYTDFYSWQREQKKRSRRFWLWFNAWQPTQTLNLLVDAAPNDYESEQSQARAIGKELQFSLAGVQLMLALGACGLFLGWVRRDIAREHE